MLQVRNLSVAVGGVTLLQGVSFKVMGGAERQTKGPVQVKGGVGYLPQDLRLDGAPDDVATMSHALSGRGLAEVIVRMENEVIVRMERLLLAMEEDPSERNIAAFSQAEEEFRIAGGYNAESEVRRLAAGLG